MPACHYGTHYTSAMIVCSYLIRLEPFTQQFLKLQGGYFDHPDRLFHSIGRSWLSASAQASTDVRELIPEFFYLPEFLSNTNKFDFGAFFTFVFTCYSIISYISPFFFLFKKIVERVYLKKKLQCYFYLMQELSRQER